MNTVYCDVNGKTLYQLHTRDALLLNVDTWMIYVMHVLECMARVDDMDADVSIWKKQNYMWEK